MIRKPTDGDRCKSPSRKPPIQVSVVLGLGVVPSPINQPERRFPQSLERADRLLRLIAQPVVIGRQQPTVLVHSSNHS